MHHSCHRILMPSVRLSWAAHPTVATNNYYLIGVIRPCLRLGPSLSWRPVINSAGINKTSAKSGRILVSNKKNQGLRMVLLGRNDVRARWLRPCPIRIYWFWQITTNPLNLHLAKSALCHRSHATLGLGKYFWVFGPLGRWLFRSNGSGTITAVSWPSSTGTVPSTVLPSYHRTLCSLCTRRCAGLYLWPSGWIAPLQGHLVNYEQMVKWLLQTRNHLGLNHVQNGDYELAELVGNVVFKMLIFLRWCYKQILQTLISMQDKGQRLPFNGATCW